MITKGAEIDRSLSYRFATALARLIALVVLCTALEKCTLMLVSSP